MSKIEEITDDTEIQQVEKVDSDSEGEELSTIGGLVPSRSEKKARKLIAKHNLKQIPGINRVTLRRPKNVRLQVVSSNDRIRKLTHMILRSILTKQDALCCEQPRGLQIAEQ